MSDADANQDDARDAKRWRKLTGCGRIRILGHARLGEPTAHIGLELWSEFPEGAGYEWFPAAQAKNAATLTAFVDGLEAKDGE